jgi:hypothetical protein
MNDGNSMERCVHDRPKTVRKRLKPDREREVAILRGVSGRLEFSKPWLARRNGISSAFKSRHMGNVGL